MASILKAARAPVLVDRLELEARERARALLEEAESKAARIVAEAEAQRETLYRASARAGVEEGRAEAGAALARAAEVRQRRLLEVEEELAAVALEVARKILGEELAARPEAVAVLARRALEPVRGRREVALRVHPEDGPRVRAELPRLSALLERAPGLCLREDAAVGRGGVVVETEAGRVDARVEAQLALLEQSLGLEAHG
jgi:type III secretion system HrpE/YscL family protein